eukprot:TRINITY_DN7969_c0_g1_i1.p2 TRINITY_DN7969_c0_g1~~TRINITY_DN7969_c0_g1_i1.p2  ORF type:complete len:521 (+),score=107.02 TRINITY_DN7969_c0_g1_i1:81-1643(+)
MPSLGGRRGDWQHTAWLFTALGFAASAGSFAAQCDCPGSPAAVGGAAPHTQAAVLLLVSVAIAYFLGMPRAPRVGSVQSPGPAAHGPRQFSSGAVMAVLEGLAAGDGDQAVRAAEQALPAAGVAAARQAADRLRRGKGPASVTSPPRAQQQQQQQAKPGAPRKREVQPAQPGPRAELPCEYLTADMRWRRGALVAMNLDGTYVIRQDDGQLSRHDFPPTAVRPASCAPPHPPPNTAPKPRGGPLSAAVYGPRTTAQPPHRTPADPPPAAPDGGGAQKGRKAAKQQQQQQQQARGQGAEGPGQTAPRKPEPVPLPRLAAARPPPGEGAGASPPHAPRGPRLAVHPLATPQRGPVSPNGPTASLAGSLPAVHLTPPPPARRLAPRSGSPRRPSVSSITSGSSGSYAEFDDTGSVECSPAARPPPHHQFPDELLGLPRLWAPGSTPRAPDAAAGLPRPWRPSDEDNAARFVLPPGADDYFAPLPEDTPRTGVHSPPGSPRGRSRFTHRSGACPSVSSMTPRPA